MAYKPTGRKPGRPPKIHSEPREEGDIMKEPIKPQGEQSAGAPGEPSEAVSSLHVPEVVVPETPAPIHANADDELARLRAEVERLKELNAKHEAQNALMPAFSHTEAFAGEDDKGREVWSYRIDLPPSGGQDIKVNGVPYFHGQTYKVTTDTLRTLKDIVARTWAHEMSIKGSNENFYRRPTEQVLRGTGARH